MIGMGVIVQNAMIGNFLLFAPKCYQQWRREVKLRLDEQAGDKATKLLSRLTTLPLSVKMGELTYMAATEQSPQPRDKQRILGLLGGRFGETDTEKSRMWIPQFTEFKRNSSAGAGIIKTSGRGTIDLWRS